MTRQDDHMEEFARSDAFFDALMLGDDPSAGTDPLAAALLDLKADVDRPMPPAPQLFTENTQPSGNVASLEEKRAKKAKRRVSPWLSGLIGAAAATVVCVGTGAVLFESDTTDEDTTVVELATTLDELEVASESGDAAAARDLLEQARDLVATIQERERRAARDGASATVTETKTVTEAATEASTVPPEGASSERPAPEQVPAPPVQQPTQAPQDPAQRGPGAGNGAGTGHGRPTQSTQPTSSSPQPSTTAGSAAPSQGQDAASESPSSEAGAEQESPSLRVNDPATMVSPPADFGAGVSGGAEGGPVVHPGAGSSS
ncbi:hypothetical protein MHJ98_03730 [Corynebacterium afermentans]|uniref:hypothetical protein n=1 Tax=Corynebacterium afermentans TaxID=38286 RepID=UPI002574852B|nr:hypothetical protein [Corynebacterium afermentans]MCG7291466.1 hypothetical protein [Corynebacterium afermentans]